MAHILWLEERSPAGSRITGRLGKWEFCRYLWIVSALKRLTFLFVDIPHVDEKLLSQVFRARCMIYCCEVCVVIGPTCTKQQCGSKSDDCTQTETPFRDLLRAVNLLILRPVPVHTPRRF